MLEPVVIGYGVGTVVEGAGAAADLVVDVECCFVAGAGCV